MLAAALIVVAPAFAESTSAFVTTKTLAPRQTVSSSRSSGASDAIQVADAQSVNNATWFAAQQLTNALFQSTGLYLTVGGGYARLSVGDFSQTTSYNEVLKTTDTTDGVGFGRMELGFQFDENWDLALGATWYGTAEAQIGFPKYPNIASLLPLPSYSQHTLCYKTTRFSLMPTYSMEMGDWMRLRVGLGLACNRTDSHIKATYQAWSVGMGSRVVSESYAGVSRTDWSGMLAVGTEFSLFKHASLNLGVAYAPYRIDVPDSRGASNGGISRSSPGTVWVNALEGSFSFNFRR